MNFKRMGVAAAGVILLAASTIFGQDAGRRLDGTANRLDRSPVSATAGGITNSAGANVIPKSDGTNLVASTVTDDGTTLTLGNAGATVTEATGAVNLTAQAATTVPLTITPHASQSGTLLHVGPGSPYFKVEPGYTDIKIQGSFARFGINGLGSIATPSNIDLGYSPGGGYGWRHITFAGNLNFDNGSAVDITLRRRAAANPAWGAAAASPVAYVHNFAADSRGGTDSNVRGGNADLAPGDGTGTAGSGQLALQTAYPGSTGTAANTFTDRWFAESVWTDLTESSATSFSKLTYAASTAVGAEWLVTVSANDGTDHQSLTSRVRVSSIRKATGDTVSEINVVGTDLTAATSGTLTCTFTDVEGATGVTVAAHCVSSLTQTVLRISYQTTVNGPATVGAP